MTAISTSAESAPPSRHNTAPAANTIRVPERLPADELWSDTSLLHVDSARIHLASGVTWKLPHGVRRYGVAPSETPDGRAPYGPPVAMRSTARRARAPSTEGTGPVRTRTNRSDTR